MALILRIVVADDDRDVREYLSDVLTRLGHDVVAAVEDGARLVAACRAHRPDLVVTDQQMPGLDGMAAAAEINRERPVVVVLVTGHAAAEAVGAAQPAWLAAVLRKPVRAADVEGAVARAAGRVAEAAAR